MTKARKTTAGAPPRAKARPPAPDFDVTQITQMGKDFEVMLTGLRRAAAAGAQLDAMRESMERLGKQMAEIGRVADLVTQIGEQQARLGRELAETMARATAAPREAAADFERAVAETLEEIEDAKALTAAREAAEEGDEDLPLALVKRLQAGVHPVKVYREHRGLTQVQLAEAAGLASGYVSQISTGRRTGTVKALRKLADALGVDLDDLMPWDENPATRSAPGAGRRRAIDLGT